MNHPRDIDELIERYLDGDLRSEEEETWEKHYFACRECFGRLQRIEAIREYLRDERPISAPATSGDGWRERLRRFALPGVFRPSPALATALFGLLLVLAVRGLVVERAAERELSALEGPRRIIGHHVVGTSRSGAGALPEVGVPSSTGEEILVSVNLAQPGEGADAFRLELRGPDDRLVWRDTVRSEGLTTPVSLALGPESETGEYRLRVEEIRTADLGVVESYSIRFLAVSRSAPTSSTPAP